MDMVDDDDDGDGDGCGDGWMDGWMDGKNEATNPPRSMPTFIGGCVNHHAVLVFQHFIVREDKGKTFCQGPCLVRGWIFSVWQTVASSGNC